MEKLIKMVMEIDASAAEWLKYEAPKLDCFTYSDDLWEVFSWDYTTQGHSYWENIAKQLENSR